MASSQIELASSHFGCVLRDHNWRNRERESNGRSQVAFQKNLKELVTDHLHTCIVLSAPIDSISSSDENSQNRIRIDNRDCWVDDRNDHNFQSVSTGEETQVESSAMNGRQSQILDRWASRQARERITTTERQTHEAELLALSNSQPVSARASTFLRESPRAPSDISVDLPNLQASSLVQRWREFETEARLTNSVNSSPKVSSARMNSTLRNTENASSYVEDTSPRSEVCDPADYSDERYEALAVQEDTFADWESDQTTPSEQLSSSQGLVSSDVGERERVRVADIIRRLTSASGNHQIQSSGTSSRVETDREQPTMIEQSSSSSQDHIVSDQGEFRGFLNGRNRLRLRGRQAFVDVLMQMERERQRELTALVERRAVSRFSHRGRIQSMLRLRFLQREVTAQGQNCPAASKLDRLQQGTTILQLRERYSPRVEQDTRVILGGEDNSGSSHTQLPNNTINLEHSDMSSQLMNEDDHRQEVTRIEQDSTPSVHLSMQSTGDDLQEEAGQSSDITFQGTSLDLSNLNQQGSVNAATIPPEWEASVVTEEPDPNAQQVVGSTDGTWLDDVSRPQRDWGGSRQAWYQDMLENLNQQETVNAAITPHDWEGNAVTEETNPNAQQVVGSTDGTLPDDVSRPQRDWGGSRQAWYQDVLENSSENGEIRELLERRSVSTSLASGFRETMDQLILSYLHRHQTERAEEEVEDNLIEHPYPEVSDGSGQIASPSLQLPLQSQLRTQSWHRDHDVNDDSNQIASTALLPSQSYYQDNQQWSPFTDRSSREMELICDLGGHMVQLHNEMSELRKLIEGCMDMQMKLQHSIKQEVSAAVYHSVRGEEVMELFNREPMRKGSCCICYEMQVDSLLYRCGHMCTCFKCAHELQWSSGRCPICGAPILDIVRAYSDS